MSFDTLGLAPELLRAVADEGYTEPTPVQREAIPLVLAAPRPARRRPDRHRQDRGLRAARLQILHETRVGQPARNLPSQQGRRSAPATARPPVRVLVVVPTRELAIQVEESVRTYGKHRPIRSTTIYGGVGFEPQAAKLRAGPEIVVATPGRLLDHVGQRTIDLSRVEILILDEADRMLDMGFIRDIRKIIDLLPPRRQNLLFSATFSDDVRGLATSLLHDPARVQVTPRNIDRRARRPARDPGRPRPQARAALRTSSRSGRIDQALVFTRTKHGANRLAEQLGKDGINAAAIHGNKSQGQRVRALGDFKAGRVKILVATDIAARGLDIEQLPHVVNYELPMVAEDYVHRIGRTGRAGTDGQAISLVCVDERPLLQDIQALLRRPIPTETIEGFEPNRSIRPEPIRLRSTPAERAERLRGSRRPAVRRARRPSVGRARSGAAGRGQGGSPAAATAVARRATSRMAPPMTHGSAPRARSSAGHGRRDAMTGSRRRSPRAAGSATRRPATPDRCPESASAASTRADARRTDVRALPRPGRPGPRTARMRDNARRSIRAPSRTSSRPAVGGRG